MIINCIKVNILQLAYEKSLWYFLFGLVRPVISPISVESQIFAGESVQLFCTVSRGDLPISSAWLFNGERLPMTRSGLTTTQVGPRTLLLAIHSATAWSSGNYTCIAENQAGVTEHTVTVLVHGTTDHTQSHVHDIVTKEHHLLLIRTWLSYFMFLQSAWNLLMCNL